MKVQAIKNYMKNNKITYDELANRTGLSISTIKKIFSGKSQYPRIDTMQAIETALGLSEATLWSEEDKVMGASNTIRKTIPPEEYELLTLYREIGQKKGASAQALAVKLLEQILNN